MAIDNLISVQFTDEELQSIDGSLTILENIFVKRCISLTPDQRQEYGRLGNKSENWSRKVLDYLKNQPGLIPAFIDVPETLHDFEARRILQPRVARFTAIMDMLNDTNLLLGSDIYQSCVAYYRNARLMAQQNVNGAKAVYDDLSAQFPGRSVNSKKTAVS